MKLEIVKAPNDILTNPCTPVVVFDEKLKELAKAMVEMLPDLPGKAAGLAANQVGHSVQLFVTPEDIYVNPKIVHVANGKQYEMEGCYSLEEGKFFKTERDQSVYMEWKDIEGYDRKSKFNGKRAQVVQHEIDHLSGKLCSEAALA